MLYIVLALMLVGFAAVSTVLYLNRNILIAGDQDEFDVYYSKAKVNPVEDNTAIKNKKNIVFEKTFKSVGDKYILDYDITNGSRNYDALVSINCVGGNDYVEVSNNWIKYQQHIY